MSLAVEVVKKQEQDDEGYEVITGGLDSNPTWEEYRDTFAEDDRVRLDLVREALTLHGLLGRTADEVCNDTAFKFSDGVTWGFTWRAWGDLQQAIEGERRGYMAFYMGRD